MAMKKQSSVTMKKKIASHQTNSFRSEAGGSVSIYNGRTPSVLDGMDEDEIVSRIMQEVRRCESSARRSGRLPSELSYWYDLDRNGSIISNRFGPQPGGNFKGHSVDDARPFPTYPVEVNTDRVGSMTRESELNDTYQNLMTSGTQRRNSNNYQPRKKRGSGGSVLTEHYNMVRYDADEADNPNPLPCKPSTAPSTPKNVKQPVADDDHLDQSNSSYSSSSTGTPQPTSPNTEDVVVPVSGNASMFSPTDITTSSALVVPPAPAEPALLCTRMSWLTDACRMRSNKTTLQLRKQASTITPKKVPSIYDRISRPFRGPSELSGRSLRTISTKSDMRSFASQNSEGNKDSDRVFFGNFDHAYHDEEDDVDVMRPWHLGTSPLMAATKHQQSAAILPTSGTRSQSILSNHSASVKTSTLETIQERSTDCNDSSSLHASTPLQHKSSCSSSTRGPSSYVSSSHQNRHHRHTPKRVDSVVTATSRSTLLRSLASHPSEFDSQYADDDKTLYSARAGRGLGCMSILQGVLRGIDEAEKAFLDEDVWTDLYDDDDIYSEASSQMLSANRSRWNKR